MLFQSQSFLLLFLPATLLLWFALAQNKVAREHCLIGLSLVFYACWDVRFVPLLLAQVLVGWVAAEVFVRTGRRAKWLIVAAIAANLAVLLFFKYSVFLAGNVALLFGLEPPELGILLPIGISFYTFEIISYLADLVWHGAPRYPLRRFALFVLLFPRLIAGPIVRHHEIVPQFDLDPLREGLYRRLAIGGALFTLGLVKKVFLADRMAPIADSVFTGAAQGPPPLLEAWSGALAFAFQLFLDFSAYSEMAIGIALMLGFTLPQNFDAPYAATSLRDFWRRWHMSLSRYLRDYVYIPLGGSRGSFGRFVAATLITMGLCGLWHGAGWMFVAWGLLHGGGLIVTRSWSRAGLPLPPTAAGWLMTFLFVLVGWVLFRAPDAASASAMLAGMSGAGGIGPTVPRGLDWMLAAAAVSMIGPTTYVTVERYLRPNAAFAALSTAALVLVLLTVGMGQPQSFIYFQF